MDYEKMLEKGMSKVPKKKKGGDRFEMPKLRVQKSGSRSIITNFSEASRALRREPKHFMKFILKELGTSGETKGNTLEVQGVFTPEVVNKKLEKYVEGFVKCKECGKHDTDLVKEMGYFFLKCEVCGAREPVGKV